MQLNMVTMTYMREIAQPTSKPPGPVELPTALYHKYIGLQRATALSKPISVGNTFEFTPSPSGQPREESNVSAGKRPLAQYLKDRLPFQVSLSRPLATSSVANQRRTEVWVADARSLKSLQQSPPRSTPGVDTSTVVVKFFQRSLMHRVFSSHPGSWDNADQFPRNEAAAYEILEDLQGSSIPYFFGKQMVSGDK